jgi:hypothetical protein
MIEAGGIHLLIIHEQLSCVSVLDSHAFAKLTEIGIVLFFLPDFGERFPPLHLEVVVLGETVGSAFQQCSLQ